MKRLRTEVLKFVSARDLVLGVAATTRGWREVALAEELWRELLLQDFGCHWKCSAFREYQQVWARRRCLAQVLNASVRVFSTGSRKRELAVYPLERSTPVGFQGICYLPSGELFLTGGKDDFVAYRRTLRVDLTTGSQRRLQDMVCMRYAHGVVHVQGSVYCFGGGGAPGVGSSDNTIESFSLSSQGWTQLPNMLTHRMMFSPVKHNRSVYIVGGCWTNKCEVFSTATCHCSPLDLKSPVKGPTCCVKLSDSVLILGSEEVWEWRYSSAPTHLLSLGESELELPYHFSVGVRVRGSVLLHGNDGGLYEYCLGERDIAVWEEPELGKVVSEEEDSSDSAAGEES